jgi:hypothetical protein
MTKRVALNKSELKVLAKYHPKHVEHGFSVPDGYEERFLELGLITGNGDVLGQCPDLTLAGFALVDVCTHYKVIR